MILLNYHKCIILHRIGHFECFFKIETNFRLNLRLFWA